MFAYEDGRKEAISLDRFRQLLKLFFLEVVSRLVGIGLYLLYGNLIQV